jgi:hypothetical protein
LVQEEFHDALIKRDIGARVRTIAQIAQASAKVDKERDEIIGWVLCRKAELIEEFEAARRCGREPPDVIPHPEHLHVVDDRLVFTGPTDRPSRRQWEHLKAIVQVAAAFHKDARERFRSDPTEESAAELKAMEKHRRWVMRNVPRGWDWREEIYCRDSQSSLVAETLSMLRNLPND